MLLIADSGSTKCDWVFANAGEKHSYYTMGFNPFFHDTEKIANEIRKNDGLVNIASLVKKLHYYGASVSSADREAIVKNALQQVFTNAEITVDHDMIGSVYATCGAEPGIACIIGTGSNSCYFDGQNISEKVPALGYILGDEGSGTWLGKRLLRDFLYHDLPHDLEAELLQTGIHKEDIFNHIYKMPNVNVYLASFAKFLGPRQHYPYVKEIIREGFEAFIKVHVCKFDNYAQLPVHFVGSVAYFSRDILLEVCEEYGLATGIITNEPIHGLVQYHLQHS